MNGDLFPVETAAAEAAARVCELVEMDCTIARGHIALAREFALRSIGQKVRWMREKREAA